jgi:hypothetical protein
MLHIHMAGRDGNRSGDTRNSGDRPSYAEDGYRPDGLVSSLAAGDLPGACVVREDGYSPEALYYPEGVDSHYPEVSYCLGDVDSRSPEVLYCPEAGCSPVAGYFPEGAAGFAGRGESQPDVEDVEQQDVAAGVAAVAEPDAAVAPDAGQDGFRVGGSDVPGLPRSS